MNLSSLEGCCGVCEISEFPYNHIAQKDSIKNRLESHLVDYCLDDYSWEGGNTPVYTNFFIATTLEKDQSIAGEVLKSLGFKSRKFLSKHEERDTLLFWTRRGLPKDLHNKIRAEVKERNKNDRW